MLDTIPLKKKNKSSKKSISTEHVSTNSTQRSSLHSKNRLKPWILVVLVLGVVVTGIVVYRSSQASSNGLGAVPQNITDIQNYIDSLSIKTPNAKNIDVSNYAEFTYAPKTDTTVKTVVYYLDGNMYGTTTKPPYSMIIDTTRIPNGEHELVAVAFSNEDVPVAAVQKTISVNNDSSILKSVNNVVTYPWNWLFRL